MRNGDDDRPEEFAGIGELAEAFTELVELLTQRRSVPLQVQQVVAFAERAMPHAEHTALTVLEHGVARTIAASSPTARRLDEIRARSRPEDCPVLDVLDINDLVSSGDLADDPRWPTFGKQAVSELGVRSLASYRLYLGPEHRAALTFLSGWPYAFDEVTLAVGAIFAAYCSLTLVTETVLQDQLSYGRAAEVHREIGLAVGILLSTGQLSSEEAYRRLHRASQQLGQSLHRTAQHVIAYHQLPTPPGTN